ncbi:hypothetical protein [Streptomyces sp. NPDC004284]|uniref:hypothetical protein n=1 Tax=Streptomyces sp. NPDC004284 TaxID=3364695 RepID=UPI0036BB6D64
MSEDEILLGLALTVVLATGSQILASKLRLPALIILLPVGFAAGALTDVVNPDKLLGPAFSDLVSLSVAVILYDAGLGLDLRKLTGRTRGIVGRLLVYGVLLTSLVIASVSPAMLDVPLPVAVTLGGILGALAFHAIASTHQVDIGRGQQLGQFTLSLAVGLVGGIAGTALLWFTLRVLRLGETLGTLAQLATVIAVSVSAGCDIVRDDTGLIAAIVVGLAAANVRGFDMPARRPWCQCSFPRSPSSRSSSWWCGRSWPSSRRRARVWPEGSGPSSDGWTRAASSRRPRHRPSPPALSTWGRAGPRGSFPSRS